jgi:hypothetical protein
VEEGFAVVVVDTTPAQAEVVRCAAAVDMQAAAADMLQAAADV